MTREEKALANDKALERAKAYYNNTKEAGDYSAIARYENIFPELRESDDERIRKTLVQLVEDAWAGRETAEVRDEKVYHACLAYLEKQKEPHYSPLCNTIKDKIREYIANYFITDTVVKTDVKSIVKAMEEGVRLGKEEQKPAEDWSEEDEKMVKFYEADYNHKVGNLPAKHVIEMRLAFRDWIVNRIKYLRPQQKQEWSEEDEVYLQDALWCVKQASKVARGENDMGACWSAERWLKSLLERFNLQPKQEWSKDDEHRLTDAIYFLESAKKHYADTSEIEKTIDWLKSRCPQS